MDNGGKQKVTKQIDVSKDGIIQENELLNFLNGQEDKQEFFSLIETNKDFKNLILGLTGEIFRKYKLGEIKLTQEIIEKIRILNKKYIIDGIKLDGYEGKNQIERLITYINTLSNTDFQDKELLKLIGSKINEILINTNTFLSSGCKHIDDILSLKQLDGQYLNDQEKERLGVIVKDMNEILSKMRVVFGYTNKYGINVDSKLIDDYKRLVEKIENIQLGKVNQENKNDYRYIRKPKEESQDKLGQSNVSLQDGLINFENRIVSMNNSQLLTELKQQHLSLVRYGFSQTDISRFGQMIFVIHQKIYTRLKENNASTQDYLSFVKIITGRENIQDGISADPRFQDTKTANQSLTVLMNQSGMWQEVTNGVKFFDNIDSPKDYTAKTIVDNFFETKQIKEFFVSKGLDVKNDSIRKSLLDNLGMSKVYEIYNNFPNDLNKFDISSGTLVLILKNFSEIAKEKPNLGLDELINIAGQKASQQFTNLINDSISDNLGSYRLFAKDLGFTGEKKDIYDLYTDINGIGIMDLSDDRKNELKEWAKVGAIMAVSIVAAVVTGGLATPLGVVATGAIAGGVAGVTGIAVDHMISDKGYDSNQDKIKDISSDLCLSFVTGVIGGAGTSMIMSKVSSKVFIDRLLKNIALKNGVVGQEQLTQIREELSQAIISGTKSGKQGKELLAHINSGLKGFQLDESMILQASDGLITKALTTTVDIAVSGVDFSLGVSTEYLRQTTIMKQDTKFIDMVRNGGIMFAIGLATGNIGLIKKFEYIKKGELDPKIQQDNLQKALEILNTKFMEEFKSNYEQGKILDDKGKPISPNDYQTMQDNLGNLREGIKKYANLATQESRKRLPKDPMKLLEMIKEMSGNELGELFKDVSEMDLKTFVDTIKQGAEKNKQNLNDILLIFGKLPNNLFEKFLLNNGESVLHILDQMSDKQLIDFVKDYPAKFGKMLESLSNEQMRLFLERHPRINQIGRIKQIDMNLDRIVQEYLDSNPLLPQAEKKFIRESIGEKAKQMIREISVNKDISPILVDFVACSRGLLFDCLKGMNIKSITHILESLIDSTKIPDNPYVQKLLDQTGGNMTQKDFFAIVTIFHDLKKSFMPAQFIGDIKWLLSGNNLTSHQKDSADLLRKLGNSDLSDNQMIASNEFSRMLDRFEIPGQDPKRMQDLLNKFADIIEGHAGNTEFMQIDAVRGGKKVLSIVEDVFNNNEYQKLDSVQQKIDYLKDYQFTKTNPDKTIIKQGLFEGNEDLFKEILDKGIGIKDPKQFDDFVKKMFLQRYLKKNLGKDIPIEQIDLLEYNRLSDGLGGLNQNIQISELLNSNQDSRLQLENIIGNKVEGLSGFEQSMNKYLNTRKHVDENVENARFIFNLHDILGYLNPAGESFLKLIGLDRVDFMIASPLNSSLATLSEIKLKMNKLDPKSSEYQSYKKMYDNGLNNVVLLINNYKQLMQKPYIPISIDNILLQKSPESVQNILKGDGVHNYGDFFKSITKLDIWQTIPSDVQGVIKQYLIDNFKFMCESMSGDVSGIYD